MERAIEDMLEEPYELDELEDIDELVEYDDDLAQPEKLFPGRSDWHTAISQLPGASGDDQAFG